MLVSKLELQDDTTVPPREHTITFSGSEPCDDAGLPLDRVINERQSHDLANGVTIQFTFSHKPLDDNGQKRAYLDYYEKVTAYVRILGQYASVIEPESTAQTFALVMPDDDNSPFHYLDTASSRAEIVVVSQKLSNHRVGIIGVGGTGSYIVDLLAKTPVDELHLWDGDILRQHNAFRAPGAASRVDLQNAPNKADYLAAIYSNMHKRIVPHPCNADEANYNEIIQLDFVFVAIDAGPSKKRLISKLVESKVPFIEVGIGIELDEEKQMLDGMARVATATQDLAEASLPYIPVAGRPREDDYSTNIQIAEMNALNAALAVIRWKKLNGFYDAYGEEICSAYSINNNRIANESL